MNPLANKCWNCGQDGCNLRKCKQPKSQARIDETKAKWQAARKAAKQSGTQGEGLGGPNTDKSGTDYQQKKWERQGMVMLGNM